MPDRPVPPLLTDVAERSRTTARERLERLRVTARPVAQTALAAAASWEVASHLLDPRSAFVAPTSAIIALGTTYGQRSRRAVEIVAGVAVGVLVADLLTAALGTGPGQIVLVVALAMSTAIALGGKRYVVSQAATSSVLIVTVAPPHGISPDRFLDACIGGAIALAINLVLFPVNPRRLVERHAGPLLLGVQGVLRDIASALEGRDHEAAEDALVRARGLDAQVVRFAEAATVAGEVATLSPLRHRHRERAGRYATAAEHADLAVRNVRVLARGAVRAIDVGDHLPPEVPTSLRELASAVGIMAPDLSDPARAERAREHALRAAALSGLALEQTGNLGASVIVGQVRSTATDVLRGLGLPPEEAVQRVRSAVAEAADAQRAQPR